MFSDLASRLLENRFTRPLKRRLVSSIASNGVPRSLLNRWYNGLWDEGRARFHSRYAKLFRGNDGPFATGEWTIDFCGRSIKLPLRQEMCWLDWDNALSILGHDIEIKQTYAALIGSNQCPTRFVDVGANYGMHSILFLSAGIPTLAFEPNPNCYTCFQAVCELNGLHGKWEQIAVGSKDGKAELVYPEKETWLGSISGEVIPELQRRSNIVVQETPLRRLDNYVEAISSKRVLIKIDAEGSELEIIQGAERVIQVCRPNLIFESNNPSKRPDLIRLLNRLDYEVHPLPWRASFPSASLKTEEFLGSGLVNFIALANQK